MNTLSDKRKEIFRPNGISDDMWNLVLWSISEQDEQFIKDLKDELAKIMMINGYAGRIKGEDVSVESIIDKLAGPKLTEEKTQ